MLWLHPRALNAHATNAPLECLLHAPTPPPHPTLPYLPNPIPSTLIRALCVLPGVGFVSASHDQSLRVWALTGETLAELYGHSAIIYCVAATPGGLIASGRGVEALAVWAVGGWGVGVLGG